MQGIQFCKSTLVSVSGSLEVSIAIDQLILDISHVVFLKLLLLLHCINVIFRLLLVLGKR